MIKPVSVHLQYFLRSECPLCPLKYSYIGNNLQVSMTQAVVYLESPYRSVCPKSLMRVNPTRIRNHAYNISSSKFTCDLIPEGFTSEMTLFSSA